MTGRCSPASTLNTPTPPPQAICAGAHLCQRDIWGGHWLHPQQQHFVTDFCPLSKWWSVLREDSTEIRLCPSSCRISMLREGDGVQYTLQSRDLDRLWKHCCIYMPRLWERGEYTRDLDTRQAPLRKHCWNNFLAQCFQSFFGQSFNPHSCIPRVLHIFKSFS